MGKMIPLIFNLIVIWLRCYVKWAVSGMRKWPSEIDMLISVGRHTWRRRWRRRTVGPNWKNPPKMRFKKFVKLTDHTCACYDLRKFWIWSACNDRKRMLCEPFVKSHQVNLFLADLCHFETTVRMRDVLQQCIVWTTNFSGTKMAWLLMPIAQWSGKYDYGK